MTRSLLVGLLVGFAVSFLACPMDGKREVCGNGKDDDGNGLSDCDDPDCAGQNGCETNRDAGYFGACPKCGNVCAKQSTCLAVNYASDFPLPACTDGRCTQYRPETRVNMRLTGDVSLSMIGSANVLVLDKRTLDGGSVNCAAIKAAAAANQLQVAVEPYNVVGFGWAEVSSAAQFDINFMPTGATNNYLIYGEVRRGLRDSTTKFTAGTLYSNGCLETNLPELKAAAATCDGGSTCYERINLSVAVQ